MKKILSPTDFSENSKNALRFALEIASKTKANLEILHVNTAAVYMPVMPENYAMLYDEREGYDTAAADELKALKNEFGEGAFAGLDIETRVEEGVLHAALNRIAEEDGCDLIVMGTKGASGFADFFIGSNTEKVIRTAICPVLAVPAGAKNFNLKTVLLPTTLQPDQFIAFVMLKQWQDIFGFKVKILYLNNPGNFDTDEEIESAVNEMARTSGLQNVETYTSSNTFNEEQTILNFAEKEHIDLIAMATHQRRGVSHMLFGSLVEDTTNHSTIPVLSIPIVK